MLIALGHKNIPPKAWKFLVEVLPEVEFGFE
jgi:hypothetical protein